MDTTTIRSFFENELRRSRWFWLTGALQAGAVVICLTTVSLHWGRSHLASNAYLLLGVALSVSIWLSCAGEFRRIRGLPIDWDEIDPSQPLHSSLVSVARLIQLGTWAPCMAVVVLMCGWS